MREVDVAVVGAGVVGLAAASAIARTGRSVVIVEREAGVGRGITARNSEVVHAGLYYPPSSLKARLCVEGRVALYAWCEERRVAYRKLGKLVVATDESEVEPLTILLERGRQNGAGDLAWLDAGEVSRLEPLVRSVAAIHSPETGIVDGQALCLSLLADSESHGAIFLPRHEVLSLSRGGPDWILKARLDGGEIQSVRSGSVVLAAGLLNEGLASEAGLDPDQHQFRQFVCKGDYFSLIPSAPLALQRLVYPLPSGAGLGIHATLDLSGAVRFGPDAEYVEAIDDWGVCAEKADRFGRAIRRYIPSFQADWIRPDYAGLRPKLAGPGEPFRDFLIDEPCSDRCPGLILCAGIESPGLTAALAIGRHVAGLL
ncbi:NAD(P)/FAD-dependent oxidoreductase [Myxococcota bacterium]|nr:NAD(P)/FAD-dependent oxidoreductase [Myxococcota bacterium]